MFLMYSEEHGLYYNEELNTWVSKDKATKFDRKEDAAKYHGKLRVNRTVNPVIYFRIVPYDNR